MFLDVVCTCDAFRTLDCSVGALGVLQCLVIQSVCVKGLFMDIPIIPKVDSGTAPAWKRLKLLYVIYEIKLRRSGLCLPSHTYILFVVY